MINNLKSMKINKWQFLERISFSVVITLVASYLWQQNYSYIAIVFIGALCGAAFQTSIHIIKYNFTYK